ncbi:MULTISPECIES: D-alanine--poly(phosphoribitol) ligase subunit 2 [unclassified Bacillus (in: firmicutes)]|uniref:D-alanine--poly(phosphoribitol) ligase subunit 2 n=1 Tax=Bacillaceae TaxID=186817 RepID=UPI000BF1C805|nr:MULTISPECIES: D-alanine--poly(phosphoribitol) ligase subunit 2 [unclassified Bacillus (in: firmicutes)]PEJ58182.1 D-alanine--poly(phosphoribitol) ligase subunit 2 [Bacillus sp. AFS002410]PEL12057.1 D-alanine--poly(phosphoribitol) ligase subunit 2 [Bacillus sp. AFS017336]
MENLREEVLKILADLCNTDEVIENPDVLIFEDGLLDSFGTVSLLVEIEEQIGINVTISDFDREEWATPNKIISILEARR